jgi:prepilin-type N-terminal cleavage/methylation domain-containing protein/prepilin-type processing-associated H-X9-DG protein
MKKRNTVRAAFTLVELLVVMSIIAMLAGLLLPAVNQVRETGRRTECISNNRQVGFALINYESKARKLPGYAVSRLNTGGTQLQAMPFVWEILDELGRPDLKRAYGVGGVNQGATINDTVGSLDLLVCPSDTTALGGAGEMSYVANCGLPGDDLDDAGSAVFFNHLLGANNAYKLTMTIASIDSGDGSTQTILIGENVGAKTWFGDPTEARVGMNWVKDETQMKDRYRINAKDEAYPHAKSFHPGGAVTCFADGHVSFIADTVNHLAWGKLHTPRGDYVSGTGWWSEPLTEKIR